MPVIAVNPCVTWSGWSDLNRRLRAPKARALAGLRHTPNRFTIYEIKDLIPRYIKASCGLFSDILEIVEGIDFSVVVSY